MDKNIETYVKQIVTKLDCGKEDKNDIAEEMKGHLYLKKNEYLIKGFTNEEATQKALEDFGDEKKIKAGLQNSMFPYFKFFRIGSWILFGVYSFIILSTLLFNRIILQLIGGWGNFHFVTWGGELSTLERWIENTNLFLFRQIFQWIFESQWGRFTLVTWGGELSTFELWMANTNLIPFRNISQWIFESQWFNTDIIIRNLVGSILIFIPLGVFLPILFKKCRKISSVVKVTILTSFMIQFLQLVFQVGQFDVDKIILHTIGGIIGYFIIKFIWKISTLHGGLSSRKMVE